MKIAIETPLPRPGKRARTLIKASAFLGLALASSFVIQPAFATVTVQGWWHLDSTQPITDSSGNGRTFSSAFSTAPSTGGQFGGLVVNNGAGGPLGTTGYSSTQAIQVGVGVGGKRQSAMWGIGYNPPATNYGIEIWVLPQDNGIAGGSGGWILSSGQAGGVAFRINAPGGTDSYIDAFVLGGTDTIGEQVPIDTKQWMHLALVNDNGVVTLYTNGVACGASLSTGLTAPAGDVYCGTPSDNQAYYGFLDEARMFTFAPGGFSTNDLLLRPPGPNIISQPQSASVWNGGAATFTVNASYDSTLLYQWRRGGANVGGQASASYYLNSLSLADDASAFDCIVTGTGISKTTAPPATLTMVPVNPSNVAAYRNAINAEASLLAYFPVDSNTGATVTNTKDGTHNGALELGATYDGRTNTTFGARSLSFNLDGDVQIPTNPAFEFAGGNGTIEALVYLSQGTVTSPTIFSLNNDGGAGAYYTLGVSANGNNITYSNDTSGLLTWTVPGGLIGKFAQVALVIDHLTNVTAYANGEKLGTKTQAGFGTVAGTPAWIGGVGTSVTDNRWVGNVDELAIYGSALPQNTIQLHYSAFVYGTNTAAPSFVSLPPSKTVFAGGSPVLVAQATGTLPLSYQWKSNDIAILGANAASLTLLNLKTGATYKLEVQNAYGITNSQPIVLTVTAPPSGYASAAMADHPTALWRLSESSGTTAVDSAGFNDGTYSGGFTLGQPSIPGETGTSVALNGTDGRAIVPLTPVLNPSGPFTCEFWAACNVTPTPPAGAAFAVPVGSMDRPGRSGGYEFYFDGNYLGYEFHTAANGGYSQIVGDNDAAPTAGTWSQVVGIYDGTNISLYVNGAPASPDFSLPESLTPNTVKGFYIGSRADNVRFFNGRIADVAFYNYALSASQIKAHLLAGTPLTATISASAPNVVADSKPVGTPHDGVNNGAIWAASNGTRTGVMQFVGTNTTQITLANNPDFQSTVGTISFWLRSPTTNDPATGSGNEGAMLVDWRGGSGAVIVLYDDGTLFFQTTPGSANSFHSAAVVDNNVWHNIALTYDQQTGGLVEAYIDGVLDTQSPGAATWAWEPRTIEIGRSHDSYWRPFNGYLDDFRIYNRVLSSTEIASIASSGALVDTAALKVRFNFDTAPVTGLSVSWSPSWAALQSANDVNGPYLNVTNALSPYIIVPAPGGKQYFRAVTQ